VTGSGRADQRETEVVLAFCPECWGYSLIERDGPIPHAKGCSEGESELFVPLSALREVEERLAEVERERDYYRDTDMRSLEADVVARAEAAERKVEQLREALGAVTDAFDKSLDWLSLAIPERGEDESWDEFGDWVNEQRDVARAALKDAEG
jgi:hypothetical protein